RVVPSFTEEPFGQYPERLGAHCPDYPYRANNIHRLERRGSSVRGQRDGDKRRLRKIRLPLSSSQTGGKKQCGCRRKPTLALTVKIQHTHPSHRVRIDGRRAEAVRRRASIEMSLGLVLPGSQELDFE